MSFLMSLALLAAFAPASRAQTEDPGAPGVKSGNYNVQESIEVGYRKDYIIGNPATFDTFVDLNTGLRLLNYNLTMRSANHQGVLFDNLTFSNFGYGGDPETVSRLRVNKNKYYDLSLLFRRHKNFWDYNVFDNPLNPNWSLAQTGGATIIGTALSAVANPAALTAGLNAGMFPSIGVNNSPHALYLVRQMQDYDLTLLPESKVRIRLGYSHNSNDGPSLNSFAGSTVGVTNFSFPLEQNVRITNNSYRMGVDFRVLPKTTISYDQFLEYNKNDTSDTLATGYQAQMPGISAAVPASMPVAIGLAFYYPPVNSGTPCGFGNTAPTAGFPVPVSNPSGLVPPFPYGVTGLVNPYCKMASSYTRTAPTRNFVPTERLSFQSKAIQRLEMSGSVSYNSNRSTVGNLYDSAIEWANPALNAATGDIRDVITSGSSTARQVATRANWTGIVTLTDKIRIVDTINYDNWRTSGNFNQTNTTLFGNGSNYATGGYPLGIFQPIANFAVGAATGPAFSAICPSPYTAATCPQHNLSAGTSSAVPDAYSTFNYDFLGQRRISNSVQLHADLTPRISGRIGYYYDQRLISETPWNALYYGNAVNPNVSAYYYPGGTNGTALNYYNAARGSCALVGGVLPSTCQYNASDGSIKYSPTLVPTANPAGYCMEGTHTDPGVNIYQFFTGRCTTTIHEQTALAGFTLRPMGTLRIYGDFQFGYNDNSYVRTSPRQVQSYKVHANYKPRTWLTIDGSMDIHENRDNVAEINNTEHGRTFGFNTMVSRTEKLILNVGYNYTDLSVQQIIAFRDNYAASQTIAGDSLNTTNYSANLTGIFAGGSAIGYLNYNPANSLCPQTFVSAPGDSFSATTLTSGNANINLCTNAFYNSHQHYAYGDVLWKPIKRVTADIGYASTFIGGSTIFPNPLQPAGTLAYNYQKPSASVEINLYKGLSYKTSWNYYAYQSKAPVIPSVTLPAGGAYAGMTYALAPIPAPDFRGSTLMFALRYAF